MTTAVAPSPLTLYDLALTSTGADMRLQAIDPAAAQPAVTLPVDQWRGALRPGDTSVLDRCSGRTLDAGCGAGRLAEALMRSRVPVLGVDISAAGIGLATRRGVPARRACLLTGDVERNAWRHVILCDGNIGIGGDPERLLRRCRDLLTDDGDLLVEIDPPGHRSWSGRMTLSWDDDISEPFPWATLGMDDVHDVASRAGLRIVEVWTEADRWFIRMVKT
jgi:SAM-dependent methyltransferase